MNPLPLVLIPGTLCDARLWEAQRNALSAARVVIVLDLGREDTLFAEVATGLKRLPPRFFIAGFSLGGIVALEYYRQAPDRIAGLALIASNARPDPEATQARRREMVARVQQDGVEALLRDELLPRYLSPHCAHPDALRALILAMAASTALQFARHCAYACQRPDSRGMLPSIRVPVLLLYGEDDEITPLAWQAEMAALMPHAQVRGVTDCGHFVPLEAPGSCIDALESWMRDA